MRLSTLEHEITTKDQLFLLHIPKTGGVSLDSIIQPHFDVQSIAPALYTPKLHQHPTPTDYFESYTYYRGHIYFDLMAKLLPGPMTCLTLLRKPIERFLSQFAHMQRLPDKFLEFHLGLTRDNVDDFETISLDEFVFGSKIVHTANFQNFQTRLIGTKFDIKDFDDAERFLRALDLDAPVELDLAKTRLNQFTFLGLTERFQDSLFLLAYTFGWLPRLTPPHLNAAPARPRQDQLSSKILGKIVEYSRLDLELYAYAQGLFEDRFTRMCNELLERYGQRQHARLAPPLPAIVIFELLEQHYTQRYGERHRPTRSIYFTFDKAISGTGWHLPEEHHEYGFYCWSGPETRSTLDFPVRVDTDLYLKFSVSAAITPKILDSLTLTANGFFISLTRLASGNTAIFEGFIPADRSDPSGSFVRLVFDVDQTLAPCSLDPQSDDDRLVGIALNWIELKPMTDELAQLRNRVQTAAQAQQGLQQRLDEAKVYAHSLEAALTDKETELNDLKSDLDAKANEAMALQTQLRQLSRAEQKLRQLYEETKDYARSLEASGQDKEAEISNLQTYIQQLQQARQDLQQIYEEARDYARSLEKSVQDRETNLKAIRQQLQTASIQQSSKEKNP